MVPLEVALSKRAICVALLLFYMHGEILGSEWIKRVRLEAGQANIRLSDNAEIYFLRFAGHPYEPDLVTTPDGSVVAVTKGQSISVGSFQELEAVPWRFPDDLAHKEIHIIKHQEHDPFWDQVLIVDPSHVVHPTQYDLIEAGSFGGALPQAVRELSLTPTEIQRQQQSLVDPIIAHGLTHEMAWQELEGKAFPLDFQKVLLASLNDSSPSFAYQNGQWFTTWLSRDLPKWNKEDHWFAPALLIGDRLVRPAPLSAQTDFVKTENGVTLPLWTLRWTYRGITVNQSMFSQRVMEDKRPHVFIRFHLTNAPQSARLALGAGRRPNAHYWDEPSRERTPIPFFTLAPKYRQEGNTLIDAWGNVLLESAGPFQLERNGPIETLLVFDTDSDGCVYLRTPQIARRPHGQAFTKGHYARAEHEFRTKWTKLLSVGATAILPSNQWMERIHIWLSQVLSITRVHYRQAERLSYGAYFYQAYFGHEEGWPVVALAQWGRGPEAQRQAELMLSPENLSKENVHHQNRNGTASWYAAEVARLTRDAPWLDSIAPTLIQNAEWTMAVRRSTAQDPSPLRRGLLPPHIYGGDIRDSATSLYSSAVCWKGLVETADVFQALGSPELADRGKKYEAEASEFKRRLKDTIHQVVVKDTRPPFLPLALQLPSLGEKNEGPYERLTDSRLGNYWNLFAPSFLHLGLVTSKKSRLPNQWVLSYMENHGGLWAGLPRFNSGLDAAYAIGNLNELLQLSASDIRYRNQALASLQSFFLHASSRNGHSIPEVAGLFPYRLDRAAYMQLVRRSPWSFGMYDAGRYLGGHISFTEPLGAGAGEALWLIRNALVMETRDDDGLADGGLFLLSTVPSDWFGEGQEIVLRDVPTVYGKISIHVRSYVESRAEIVVDYDFSSVSEGDRRRFWIRLAPPGRVPQDIPFDPSKSTPIRAKF